MNEENIFSKKVSWGLTIDKIIEKFIPIIWAILLVTWFVYLLYTNVWVDLSLEIRLWLGFFLSIILIGWAVSFSERLRYFADIVVWIWILLLYATLMYGSRTTETAQAVFPEVATLVTAFIFTLIIAYFASFRKSKVILILWMIWAYITPFVIGQNDVWAQTISFNAYLTYFASISIVVFLIWKEISTRNIIPLNMIGLFVWTSTLYKLSYTDWISTVTQSNFFSWEIFSAILFLFLAIFSMWSIIITSKQFEEKDEWYIAFGYIATILWFIFNLSLLTDITDITKSIFFVIISASCFYGWHFLRNTKTRFQHTSLYSAWILTIILAFFNIIPDLNLYSSLAIAYSSLIFGVLYYLDSKKFERLASYWLLSLIWAILSLWFISDIEGFKTIHVILALVPAMAWIFVVSKSDNENYKEFGRLYSFSAFIIACLYLIVDFFKYIDLEFFLFYISSLFMLVYILFSKISHESKSSSLRFVITWFVIGYIWIFFLLLKSIYPAPTDTFLITNGGLFSDLVITKWILAVVIFFLWLKISRNLQKKQIEERPSFLLVIMWYTSLLLIGNYIFYALVNDFWVDSNHGWIRAIIITIWWVLIALYMLITWIKKGEKYRSEKLLWLLLLFLTIFKIALYDMSMMWMENKIIILMTVGWFLMIFSYFVHSKWWLSSSDTTENNFNKRILKTDISGIEKVKIEINDDQVFKTSKENVMKIIYFVTDKFWKTEFEKWELEDVYDYIVQNYKSELDKETYERIRGVFKSFVKKWWKITFM